MDSSIWSVRMIADEDSLKIMQQVGKNIGARIEILAKGGTRYSYRGGEGTSLVPDNSNYICIHAGNQIKDFWEKVSKEKTKQRLIWLAAHPEYAPTPNGRPRS